MNCVARSLAASQVPAGIDSDLAEFREMVSRFRTGELSAEDFRAFRVPRGIYEQRESGTYMLRVRVPAGALLAGSMRRLAEVAQTFGNGVLHVTTRQDVQIHRVRLEGICPALESLREAGLTAKGGGGNTVRNITACADCGICADETFDVAPFALALTERFMNDPTSFQLPRKYKIAFSGCPRDCAGAGIHDLGFIAQEENGVKGFAVYVGGGMGGKSRVAELLHDFVPAADAFLVGEAIKRVFHKHGERKDKHRARLRFLVERIGFNTFTELYQSELRVLQAAGLDRLQPEPLVQGSRRERVDETGLNHESGDYEAWRRLNVRPQKQAGFFIIDLPLPLGDIAAEKLAALAEMVTRHQGISVTATQSQNFALSWVTAAELAQMYGRLRPLGLAQALPPVLRNLVACAGASTCRLGICLARGLAKAMAERLASSDLDLERVGEIKIQISGCPNSCGRHRIADIGFEGAARSIGGKLVPHYTVLLGGRLAQGKTRFGQSIGTIPAKNLPAFLQDFLAAFLASVETPDFQRFLDNGGLRTAAKFIAQYQAVPAFEQNPGFYSDWGAEQLFSLAGRGPGECSAGPAP